MSENPESEYWLGRELAQREMEAAALDPAVKKLHRSIADGHADKAWREEALEEPEHETDVEGHRARPAPANSQPGQSLLAKRDVQPRPQ